MPIPPLAGALRDIVLEPDHAPLLRVCLFDGPAWRTAWEAWRNGIGDPRDAFSGPDEGLKGLLPLLFVAVRRSGVDVDRTFLTFLRTAYVREAVRFKRYAEVCHEVLATLNRASIEPVVLRGNAHAETVYPEVGVRHSNGLNVWLENEHAMSRAIETLVGTGLEPSTEPDFPGCATLVHPSRMRVFLQTDLFPHALYTPAQSEVWRRSVARTIAGAPARILAPEDSVIEGCARASIRRDRGTLRWACDVWLLITGSPGLDWDLLVETTLPGRLALPLFVTLEYLADALAAPVPRTILDRLSAAASRDTLACELALRSVQRSENLSLPRLVFRPTGWRARASVARHLLLPSPQYMRWTVGLPENSPTMALHVHRFRSFLAGELAGLKSRLRRDS